MRVPVTEYLSCNYGSIPSNTVMTSSLKTKSEVAVYKNFLLKAVEWFGPSGQYKSQYDMFNSQPWGYFDRKNLLFTDSTQTLVDVGEKNTYYSWVGKLKLTLFLFVHKFSMLFFKVVMVYEKRLMKKCFG